jgi:TonB family protein
MNYLAIRRLLAAALLSFCPVCTAAQEGTAGPMEDWQNQLRAIGAAVIDGKFAAAEQASAALANVMADQIVGGVGTDLLFGITTAYRAAALVGQGRIEEGVWHWQVAQQLFPRVAEIDLAHFGSDAAILAEHPPRVPQQESTAPGVASVGTFVPPRRLESPLPRFPTGRALQGLKVDVVVQVIVGMDGRPREPVILDSRGEVTLVYSALDALSRWVFEPGRRDGVAEPALYKLTVTFVVPDA